MKVTITTTVNLAEEFLVVPVHGSLKEPPLSYLLTMLAFLKKVAFD